MTDQNVAPLDQESDTAVAERVRRVLGRGDPDLAEFLCRGGTPGPGTIANAIRDAKEITTMLGCAFMGTEAHFGGQPSHHVVSAWTFLAEQKLEIAEALALEQREGRSRE